MYTSNENRSHTSKVRMRMYKRKPARLDLWRLYLQCTSIWITLLTSTLILAGCNLSSSTNVTTSEDTLTPKPQVRASWLMQFETAQKEAAKIDPTAVIHWVSTAFTDAQLHSDSDISLRTDFIFIRPNGVRLEVGVEDTSPPGVLWVDPEVDTWTIKPSPEDLERYASLFSNVKIGPRELARKIFDKNMNSVAFVSVSIGLNWDHQKEVGVVNPWVVGYAEPSMDTSTRLLASPDTGEILKRDTYTLAPQN